MRVCLDNDIVCMSVCVCVHECVCVLHIINLPSSSSISTYLSPLPQYPPISSSFSYTYLFPSLPIPILPLPRLPLPSPPPSPYPTLPPPLITPIPLLPSPPSPPTLPPPLITPIPPPLLPYPLP